jgi:hypothetical protein
MNKSRFTKKFVSALGLVALLTGASGAWADASADQLEQSRLLREFRETRPYPEAAAHSLPGGRIEEEPGQPHRQQLEDSQWRNLLGAQQAQLFAPDAQANERSQWRSQTFDRERSAQDLSADILRRSRQYLSNGRH